MLNRRQGTSKEEAPSLWDALPCGYWVPGSVTGHPVPFLEVIVGLVVLDRPWPRSQVALHSLGLSFLSYKTMDLGYLPPKSFLHFLII